jgi:thiosulfate/3-mercaptopyruvate sulfurtransferase
LEEPEIASSTLLHGPLISAAELGHLVGHPRLRIADVRWYLGNQRRGRDEYAHGHLPGAVFVDLDHDLAAPAGPGRHPLPDPTAFADRMGQLGFGDEHAIVAYDGSSGMVAARLWWMLTDLGRRDVAVLDGGLQAWLEAGGELTPILPTPLRTTLTVSGRWSRTIDRQSILDDPQAFDLVDVRAPERYRGETEPVDRIPGHIPGARNQPAATLLDDRGRLLPAEHLEVLLRAEGARAGRPGVMSCGSGVTACLGVLAARVAGLPQPFLYPGSYSDWSTAHLPISTGEEP